MGDNIPEFEAMGYESPRHFQYITCGRCLKRAQEKKQKRTVTHTDGRLLRSVKRLREFGFDI